MPTTSSNRRKLLDLVANNAQKTIKSQRLRGQIVEVENEDPNNTVSVFVFDEDGNVEPNKLWCLLEDETNPTAVYAPNIQPRKDAPVWVINKGDGYEVESVQMLEGTNFYGEGLGSINTGVVFNEIWPFSLLARNYRPGQVIKSSQGGLWVFVFSFRYVRKDGSIATSPDAELDLTPYLPSGSGMWSWVIVCVDPATNTLTAVQGDEYAAPALLTADLLDDIDTYGLVPVDALKLENGQTEITGESEFTFGRALMQHRPRNNFEATTAPTTGDDETLGYEVGSQWIDVSSGGVYTCSDASTGAAVWNSGGTSTLYYQELEDGGTPVTQRNALNLVEGSGISLTFNDDAGNDRTDITIAATAGGTNYQTVQDNGVDETQRAKLNLIEGSNITLTFSDNAGNDSTDVTIASTGGGGTLNTTTETLYTRTMLYEDVLASPGTWDVSSISQDYDTLEIELWIRTTQAVVDDAVFIAFNNDTTAINYLRGLHIGGSSNTVNAGADRRITAAPGATALANSYATVFVRIPNYTNTSHEKIVHSLSADRINATVIYTQEHALHWENTAAINRIAITPDGAPTDSFATGSFIRIVGVKETDVVTDVTGGLQGAAYSTDDVSNPPTDAEIDTAFGTPATVGAGYAGVINDNNAGTDLWFCVSDGSAWWYLAMTKAT